jgi:hypothetical protein
MAAGDIEKAQSFTLLLHSMLSRREAILGRYSRLHTTRLLDNGLGRKQRMTKDKIRQVSMPICDQRWK